MKVVVFVLLLVAIAHSQYQSVFYIDYFRVNSSPLIIQVPNNPSFPYTRSGSTQTSTVIGGERDLFIQMNSGQLQSIMSAGVSGGNFTASTPISGSGLSTLTYDGTDNSNVLNPSGLYGSGYSNFLSGGGFALSASIRADISTTVSFNIYSGSTSTVCKATINISGSRTYEDYIIQFSSFSSGCNFANVGAVVVEFMLPFSVDIEMQYLSVYGIEPVLSSPTTTTTPSRTRSTSGTASRTRVSPYSTPSNTRTGTQTRISPNSTPTASRTPLSETPTATTTPSRTRSTSGTASRTRVSPYSTPSNTRTVTQTRISPNSTPTASRTPLSGTPTTTTTPSRTRSTSGTASRTRISPNSTPSNTRTGTRTRISPNNTPTVTPSNTRTSTPSPSRTRTPSKAAPNCYSYLNPTPISAGSCMVLNSCTVTNKQSVYFQYDYSYEDGKNSSSLAYYFIPSDQPISSCNTLAKYCYNVCGATANPLLGYIYLGDVNYHNFQLWAYHNSNSGTLFVNGTSLITYSN